jgi:hypothetical protein
MPPNELLQLIRAAHFVPFRVYLDDGSSYEIHHPDLVIVGVASAVIGFPSPDNPGLYDRTVIVALRHISRLEPIGPAAQAG